MPPAGCEVGFYCGRFFIWGGDEGERVMYPSAVQIQPRNDSWNTAQNFDLASETPLVLIQSDVMQWNNRENRSSGPT